MAVGWKHKDFWVLPWADEPMPEVGKTIVHGWTDERYKILFVKDDLVVLQKEKLKEVTG